MLTDLLQKIRDFFLPSAVVSSGPLLGAGNVHGLVRHPGMQVHEWEAYLAACAEANVSPDRIIQVVGNAPASQGYHLPDGQFTNSNGHLEDYTAALDLSVKHPNGHLSTAQIKKLLDCLAKRGFIGWYRPWGDNEHIHVVYCGLPMKKKLRDKVHDWLKYLDGLVEHGYDGFVLPTTAEMNFCRALFLAHNPANG